MGRMPDFCNALLAGFAELVTERHPGGEVVEVGSGPGRVTAHLRGLGLSVRGVDLSPAMVDLARHAKANEPVCLCPRRGRQLDPGRLGGSLLSGLAEDHHLPRWLPSVANAPADHAELAHHLAADLHECELHVKPGSWAESGSRAWSVRRRATSP